MKRSPALQSLSREHHAALKLARACERAVDAAQVDETCLRVIAEFANELEQHFMVEENELLPLLAGVEMRALAERTLAEHAELRAQVEQLRQRCDADTLLDFGKSLAAHVRFEERELFPALEELL
jgi:hemerythrin-like domain-containing protein